MYHNAETLVIGGGAIGICCAYYLNKLGKNVTVVEKDDICAGSSYGNAGLIVPSHSIPMASPGVITQGLKWMFNPESPFYIKPRLQREFLSWLWKFRGACNERQVRRAIPVLRDLNLAGIDLFGELAALKDVDFGYEQKGNLEVFRTQKKFNDAAHHAHLLKEYGVESRKLERHELREFLGERQTNAIGGIFYPLDGHLVPDRFVRQLASHIEHKGVRLLARSEVIGFETTGRKLTAVHTTRGDMSAENVVLAGGSWTVDLARELNIRLMIEPAKGYSITFKRPAADLSIPVVLAEARVVLTPMEDMIRFAGTLELAGFDQSIDQRRVKAIIKAVPTYFPDIDPASLELIEIWRGLRPCSADGLPLIGRPRQYDNVIIATGHGMLGISLAPITGKIVSQIEANQMPAMDLTAFGIERFN